MRRLLLSSYSIESWVKAINASEKLPDHVVIADKLPAALSFQLVECEGGEFNSEVSGSVRNIIWTPKDIPINQEVSVFIKMIGDGSKFDLSKFAVESSSMTAEIQEEVESENQLRLEKIIMPEVYRSNVDS